MVDEKKTLGMSHSVSWLSVLSFVLIALMIGFTFWSAYFKRSSVTKVGDGGIQNVYYNAPTVPLLGAGCMNLRAELFWQKAREK